MRKWLILPGCALTWAISSGAELTGTDGLTSRTSGERVRPATIAMSRMKLKLKIEVECRVDRVGRDGSLRQRVTVRLRVGDCVGCDIGGGAWPVLDNQNGFGQANSDSHWPIRRARISVGPPAAKPTMMCTGRVLGNRAPMRVATAREAQQQPLSDDAEIDGGEVS